MCPEDMGFRGRVVRKGVENCSIVVMDRDCETKEGTLWQSVFPADYSRILENHSTAPQTCRSQETVTVPLPDPPFAQSHSDDAMIFIIPLTTNVRCKKKH